MSLYVTFLLGVLTTWIGLGLSLRSKKRDKRSIVSARIHRSLDASARIARSNRAVGPIVKAFESVGVSPGVSYQQPKQAYDAAIKEVTEFKEFIRVEPKCSEYLAELRKHASTISSEERERIKKLVTDYKAQIPNGTHFPSDEDLTYLEARIAPFAFEYKQRLSSMLGILELMSASDFGSWPDNRLRDWLMDFFEQLMILAFLERLLREATEKETTTKFPWI